jgi:hypothetical protein
MIDSISIPFEESINAQALQHESVMVDVCTKRKPDSFKSQLQAVLTAYYEDIKGVRGASGCPRPKTKIIKCRFEWNNAQGRGRHRGRGWRRRSSACRLHGSCCSPRWRGSCCSPASGEEPAAAPAVAESAPSQAGNTGGLGGKKTKG